MDHVGHERSRTATPDPPASSGEILGIFSLAYSVLDLSKCRSHPSASADVLEPAGVSAPSSGWVHKSHTHPPQPHANCQGRWNQERRSSVMQCSVYGVQQQQPRDLISDPMILPCREHEERSTTCSNGTQRNPKASKRISNGFEPYIISPLGLINSCKARFDRAIHNIGQQHLNSFPQLT